MSKSLKFYLLTDTHYYNPENGPFTGRDQVCLNEGDAIIKRVFEQIAADDEINIVLISGDLANSGYKNEHSGFLKRLQILKDAGKRVFVITATHDYGLKELDENYTRENVSEDLVMRDDLAELYKDYGPQEAIASHKSMSYCVQLSDDVRLLCLNDDGNGRSFCGYDEDELNWILEQIDLAKKDGQFIFAMTHHPTLPPSPVYPVISERDMLGDWDKTTTILADAGLRFIFTGHTHMQNIASKRTEAGNTIYDINTGSVIGYPGPMRVCEITDDKFIIRTKLVDTIDNVPEGRDLRTHMKITFDAMLNNIFDSMAFDFNEFCGCCGAFSVDGNSLKKYESIITFVGKTLQKLTLGKLGVLLCCRSKIRKEAKDLLLKDVIVECTRNIWEGNEPYGPGTALGDSMDAIAHRLQPVVGKFASKAPYLADFPGFLRSIMYDNDVDDWNVDLKKWGN